jgi:hypothetical protein
MISEKDEIMKELGYISVTFSTFDSLIQEINSFLINPYNIEIGNFISGELTTQRRIELYSKLLEFIPFSMELVSEAKSNLKKFSDIKKFRNDIIHGVWHTKGDEDLNNDDLFLGKLNALNLDQAKKINTVDIIKIKDDLLVLVDIQFNTNLKLRSSYYEILKKEKIERDSLTDLLAKQKDLINISNNCP